MDEGTPASIGNPIFRWQLRNQLEPEEAASTLGLSVDRYAQIAHLSPMTDDEIALVGEKTGIGQERLEEWTRHVRQRAVGRALRGN
jgi:hypothetical protein